MNETARLSTEVNDKVIIAENSSGIQARVQFDVTVDAIESHHALRP